MRGKNHVVGLNFERISSENDVEMQNKILTKFESDGPRAQRGAPELSSRKNNSQYTRIQARNARSARNAAIEAQNGRLALVLGWNLIFFRKCVSRYSDIGI